MIKLLAVVLILGSLDQAKSQHRPECVTPGSDRGASYRGDVDVTELGIVCQRWDSKSFEGKSYPEAYPNSGLDDNYCRNIDGNEAVPWCFVDADTKQMAACAVPNCYESCKKPIIGNGMVSPDKMAIDSGATYSVTCDATFKISGSPIINCGQGNQLSELPTCEPASENDGNDNGETEDTSNQDYSGAGYTNISTILFVTLMCKIVMIY